MPEKEMDLFEEAFKADKGKHIFTVSEIAQDIKIILENTYPEIWVEGEISNFQPSAAGHFYFTLKDDSSVLPAAMFGRANKELKFKVENGLKVICLGKISAYGPRGNYQIIVEKIEPKGIGSLQLALEQLKKKLEKEGLFAPEHKRPIPYLPSRIGVVTSAQGAAIRDILKVLDRRFSDINIVINHVQVQGEAAKTEIAQAIREFNALNDSVRADERIEVLIVGRGGGSIEDLWAFNEEVVARAIYDSRIPIVSAVGHERDWTIADLVADVRAATPSVAAELVVPKKEELKTRLSGILNDLSRSLSDLIVTEQDTITNFIHRLKLNTENIYKLTSGELEAAQKKLALLNPIVLIQQYKEKLFTMTKQIAVRAEHLLQLRYAEFSGVAEKLSSLSPLNILGRGYSITFRMPDEAIIKDAGSLKAGESIKTRLHKGEVVSTVTQIVQKKD